MGLFGFLKKKITPPQSGQNRKAKTKVTASVSIVDHSDDFESQIVPIEKRVKQLKPVAEGLYVHEILLLSYAEKYHLSGDDYPGFWWWNYGIKDVHGMLNSLLARGFLREGDDAATLKACTATELKDFLKSQGLKVSGKKDELVNRILVEASSAAVRSAFPSRTYALTERGRKVLDANSAIIEAHKDPEKRIWDVPASDLNRPPKTNDERWGEMNAAYLERTAAGDFDLAASTKMRMADFLADEGRYIDAILSLCAVMVSDLSGAGNGFKKDLFLQVRASFLFPYKESLATIPPGIISAVEKWQSLAGLDDDQLQSLLLKGFEQYKSSVPISIFTPEESLTIFNMERAGDKKGLSAMYETAKHRFHKRYPSANLERL